MSRLRSFTFLVLAAGLIAGCGARAQAPTPSPSPSSDDDDGIKPYSEVVTPAAESDSGLFTVHRIDDKVLYEIPQSELGREMLLVSRIARTATDLGYGGEKANTSVVRWQRQGDRVLLRVVSYENVAADSLPIYEAVRNANFEPIVASFDIEAFGPDSAAVIDVAKLFTTDIPLLGLSSGQRERYEIRRLDESRTFLESARSYPRNIEVRSVLTYEADEPPSNESTGAISLEMNHSMLILPADPMEPRRWDERVGFFRVEQTDYGLEAQRAEERRYITRYRLEPTDTAAFLRGELVEPVEPIVYYIDPATPQKWRPYLKQGVEDWNEAFRAAGFKNAIIAKDPPTEAEDPEFSPEDARYSVIRYFPSDIQNAYGPHVHDPRTGEILESDIGWYHNVMNLVRNWYFVQTAAANPEARAVEFDTDVMGQLVRFVSAHEVGHTLGLPHNMKASAAYPVDSLRTSFSCEMGTAPSIMDYARFNYVAQPGDEGVCFLPKIGPYDVFAIMWGYRPIIEADSPEEEQAVLHGWIREREDNPIYRFGNPSSYDPTSLTEALGADAMKASEYGIANLKRIVPRLIEWTSREGEDYAQLAELYRVVISQWNDYVGHVATNIGGVYRTRKTYDQPGAVYEPVPEPVQRRALDFLATHVFETPDWMLDRRILSRIEHAGAVERTREIQADALEQVLTPTRMQRLIEAGAVAGAESYTLGEMLDDLRGAVWSELAGGNAIDVYRRNLQRAYIERMEWLLTEEPEAPPEFVREYYGYTDVDVSQSDIRAFARGELETLEDRLPAAIQRAPDRATRVHLQAVLAQIDEILNPED